MSTLQRQHYNVQYNGPGLPFVTNRIGGLPARQEKAFYLFNDTAPAALIADADPDKPSTAPRLSGGSIAKLTNGGVNLFGKAAVPQAAGTEIDITQAWTVWAAFKINPDSGADVWTIFEDYSYYAPPSRHGFAVFAQSVATTATGDQIALVVRMSNNGGLDFGAAFNMQVPPNAHWTYGKNMLASLTHDGFGNIVMQIYASNGLVSQGQAAFNIDKGSGPIGAKTSTTRWQLGGGFEFTSPGMDVEGWGVLQRQWTNDDALLAYSTMRELALSRGRPWT